MPAAFPDAIYDPTVKTNRPGVVYDETKTKRIYAEDFNLDRDEIVAIETYLKNTLFGLIYPIGHIYISVDDTNPGDLFGGTWVAFGAGRTLVGIDSSDTDFDTVEETRGAKTHTLTDQESGLRQHNHTASSGNDSPDHSHQVSMGSNSFNATGNVTVFTTPQGIQWYHNVQSGGASARHTHSISVSNVAAANAVNAHNNIQPSIVVYMWKRTA